MAIRPRTAKATVATWTTVFQLFVKGIWQPAVNWLTNWARASVPSTTAIFDDFSRDLGPAVDAVTKAIKDNGDPILKTFLDGFGSLANSALLEASATLEAKGLSLPDGAIDAATAALRQAFGFGMGSFATTAAFEMLLPKKLNTLNGIGPLLAQLAGFEEVAEQVRDPLYENAFGKSLDYHYKSLFKPEFASEKDAVKWFSQRVMTKELLEEVFRNSGLKTQYETSYVDGAYRAIQPRALATMIQDTPFPLKQMVRVLQFGQYRDEDIDFLLPILEFNSTKNVRLQYLSTLERSVELGTDTVANLDAAMTSMNFSDDAKHWVQLTVAERKLQQLAELYRKSVSEAYKYGQVTDANYVSSLEAIGISAADAQAHYAIDSIAKNGRIAAALLKAEERLADEQKAAAMRAAIAEFRAGTIDAAALEVALLAAGIDPVIASFAVTMQTALAHGTLVLVYGLELPKTAAMLLREKVAALKEQAVKKLGTPTAWLAELAALGIPDPNARALVAEWDAQAFKAVIPA